MLLARIARSMGCGTRRRCGCLWRLTATVAPAGLILLRRYIRVHEAGRED